MTYRDTILKAATALQVNILDVVRVADAFNDEPVPATSASAIASAAGNAKVIAWLMAGKKVLAIKEVRCTTGLGLKEAKDAVESISLPDVNMQIDASDGTLTFTGQ